MSLRIDPRIFPKYPELMVGTVVCRDLTNGPAPPELTAELREAERELRARIPDAEGLKVQQLTRRFCGEGCTMTALIHTNEGGS